ncbi:hypothetical protein HWV62_1573 [Athelia sp. TMB]|nr:hypothetical protein HWV62_1573 [Athelia sp. TMB]
MSTAQPVQSERPRSPGNPTLTHHTSHFNTNFPTPSLLESVAGGAHYAGVKIDTRKIRRTSAGVPSNHLEIKGDHRRVIEDLQELYCCRPTPEILARRWRPDAQFEDPLCKCQGYKEYAAQAKLYSKSETISTRVMSSTTSPNRLVFAQTQVYSSKVLRNKTINSIIIVDLDEQEKIIRLVDEWNGKPLPTKYGAKFLRRANAMIAPLFVKVPKATPVAPIEVALEMQ